MGEALGLWNNSCMKEKIFWLAKYLGVFLACRWLTRRRVRVLAYHGIWLGDEHFGNYLYMSPGRFRHRMQLLKKWGYPVVPLSSVIEADSFKALPNCAVVLTIDDGWYGTYLHMLPVLEKLEFPATIYVSTYYCENQVPVYDVVLQYVLTQSSCIEFDIGLLEGQKSKALNLADKDQKEYASSLLANLLKGLKNDQARQEKMEEIGDALGVSYRDIRERKLFHLMTMEQIGEIDRRGIDVQLHTHRHRISYDGQDCIGLEVEANKASLAEVISHPLIHFCYPSGVYDASVWPQLKAADVVSATTTAAGLVSAGTNRFALPRILDGEQVSDLAFEAELSGFSEIKRSVFAVPSRIIKRSSTGGS